MTALEKIYINKGKAFLTDTEIQDFISSNKIDIAFEITKVDVKKALQAIDKKWHPSVCQQQTSPIRIDKQKKLKLHISKIRGLRTVCMSRIEIY